MRLRKWESWVEIVVDDLVEKEHQLRRHFTRKAAEQYAFSIAVDPSILMRTILSLEKNMNVRVVPLVKKIP